MEKSSENTNDKVMVKELKKSKSKIKDKNIIEQEKRITENKASILLLDCKNESNINSENTEKNNKHIKSKKNTKSVCKITKKSQKEIKNLSKSKVKVNQKDDKIVNEKNNKSVKSKIKKDTKDIPTNKKSLKNTKIITSLGRKHFKYLK